MSSFQPTQFTVSGTEAIMMGLGLARPFSGRGKVVLSQEHCFGWYDATLTGLVELWDQPVSARRVRSLMERTIAIP
jgi:glutamate-1-semialdehyde aminotransferase